ncbi:MAG: hypothetical protein ACK5X3_09930 [Pseudomonadota bacterium]
MKNIPPAPLTYRQLRELLADLPAELLERPVLLLSALPNPHWDGEVTDYEYWQLEPFSVHDLWRHPLALMHFECATPPGH